MGLVRDHSRIFAEITAAQKGYKMKSIAYLSILSLFGLSYQMPTSLEDHHNKNLRLHQVEDIGPELVYESFPEFSDVYKNKLVIVYYPAESLNVDSNDLKDGSEDDKPIAHIIGKREVNEQENEFDNVISGVEIAEKGDLVSNANGRKRVRFPPAFHG